MRPDRSAPAKDTETSAQCKQTARARQLSRGAAREPPFAETPRTSLRSGFHGFAITSVCSARIFGDRLMRRAPPVDDAALRLAFQRACTHLRRLVCAAKCRAGDLELCGTARNDTRNFRVVIRDLRFRGLRACARRRRPVTRRNYAAPRAGV